MSKKEEVEGDETFPLYLLQKMSKKEEVGGKEEVEGNETFPLYLLQKMSKKEEKQKR